MQSIHGKVTEFLRGTDDRVYGFALDSGREIRSSHAQMDLISDIVTPGSRVQIVGDLQFGDEEKMLLKSAHFTNLDSKQTFTLPAPVCLGKPGMLFNATPTPTASLAFQQIEDERKPPQDGMHAIPSAHIFDLRLGTAACQTGLPTVFSRENLRHPSQPVPRITSSDSAGEMERAYDSLHRIQAVLAYLHIMNRQVYGMSQMHEEAQHTYRQALSRHTTGDFAGAREFAAASGCLSRVIEGVISRSLRSDTSYPSLVPPPPVQHGPDGTASRVQKTLAEVEALLSRVHWLLENGTLPLENRTQVRRITTWSDFFYQQARRTYRQGELDEGCGILQAAWDSAHSAEHICRNWYVVQAYDALHHMSSSDPPRT
ncbi:MAG: hypothetical protein WA542_17505 [Candidatus Acidiferrum sp.]